MHMIRLLPVYLIRKDEANEVVLINSHDGTSSYQMLSGVFRYVCHNGMVLGDTVEDIRVPHRGNVIDNVIEATYTIKDQFDSVNGSIETMKSLPLSSGEELAFARAALELKYDDPTKAPIGPEALLSARRSEDRGGTLWNSFNRVQENIIKGGLHGYNRRGRTTTREVKSIDNNGKLNRALWVLADEMAKLKK